MSRVKLRRPKLLLCATFASLAASPVTLGAPTAPTLVEVPDSFSVTFGDFLFPRSDRAVEWTSSVFALPCRAYEVEVWNINTGTTDIYPKFQVIGSWPLSTNPVSRRSFGGFTANIFGQGTSFTSGQRYRFRVRGVEYDPLPALPDRCEIPRESQPVTVGPWSNWSRPTLADMTPPAVILRIDGIDSLTLATRSLPFVTRASKVVVEASAVDSAATGLEASGIAQVGVPGLAVAADRVAHTVTIEEGLNVIDAYAWDRAGTVGHATSATVYRDTTGPVVAASHQYAWTVLAGSRSVFRATGGDPGGPTNALRDFRWTLGDGSRPVSGQQVGHVYRRAGLFCGTATARDLAGNRGSTTFAVRVGLGRIPRIGSVTAAGPRRLGTTLVVRSCIQRAGWVETTLRRPDGHILSRNRQYAQPGYVTAKLRATRRGNTHVTVTVTAAQKTLPITIQ